MSGMMDLTAVASGGSGPIQVFGEDHTNTVVAGVFTTDYPYIAGTTRMYINGVRLRSGADNDYTESQPGLGEVTLLGVWASVGPSDVVLIDYDRA